jgi:hypothetical protein
MRMHKSVVGLGLMALAVMGCGGQKGKKGKSIAQWMAVHRSTVTADYGTVKVSIELPDGLHADHKGNPTWYDDKMPSGLMFDVMRRAPPASLEEWTKEEFEGFQLKEQVALPEGGYRAIGVDDKGGLKASVWRPAADPAGNGLLCRAVYGAGGVKSADAALAFMTTACLSLKQLP